MKIKPLLLYSIFIAGLAVLLKWLEYRFWIRGHMTEIYIGCIAALFLGLGVWMGMRWTAKRPTDVSSPKIPAQQLDSVGLSKREQEVLVLLARGYSNQEIADELFVSLSTVKSHVSNLFSKLDVKRRTQAMQKAKELGII